MEKPYGYNKELGGDTKLDSLPDPAILERLLVDLGFHREGATSLVNKTHWQWVVNYAGLQAQVCAWMTTCRGLHTAVVFCTDYHGSAIIVDFTWCAAEGWQVNTNHLGEWVLGQL